MAYYRYNLEPYAGDDNILMCKNDNKGLWVPVMPGDRNIGGLRDPVVIEPALFRRLVLYLKRHGLKRIKMYGDDAVPQFSALLPHPDKLERFFMGESLRLEAHKVGMAAYKYGGDFARHWGQSLIYADLDNMAAMRAAFPYLWEKYLSMAQQRGGME